MHLFSAYATWAAALATHAAKSTLDSTLTAEPTLTAALTTLAAVRSARAEPATPTLRLMRCG